MQRSLPAGQAAHSNRHGPWGLHSQNLLQSEILRGLSIIKAVGQRLTVLVYVVVGGDVALQVGGAVRHQAAVILDTLGAVLR